MDIRSTNPKLFLVEKARVKRKIDKKKKDINKNIV